MKKRWLTMLTTMFALTFTLGLAACGGCSSCDTSSGDASSGTQSSSIAGSIAESSEEEMSSSETEESSEFTTSPMFSSLEDVESSEAEESAEIVESSEEDSSVEEESSSEEDSSVEEESSSEEENEEKTDEEIFAEIKAAVLATQNYNGAVSMKFRAENLAVGDEGYEAGYFTCNPETLEYALDGEDNLYITKEKIFKKDGKYYIYYANGTEAELEETQTCEETTANRAKAYQANYLDYYSPWAVLGNYGTFAVADSYAELLEAFEIVGADTLADMKTDGYVNLQSTYVVDLGTEGGKSWITFTINGSFVDDPNGSTSDYQSQMVMKFVVEGGYVAYVEQSYYSYSTETWGEEEYNRKDVYEYTYAFDQAFFDSIIPCEPQAKTEYLLQVNLHLPYNYIDEEYVDVTAETTKEDILGELNDIFWNIPEDLNLEMDAWYLDEACTVKFDPDAITDLLEYERITDLYVKSISFNPNYAWVITEHQLQEQYSKPYQITKMFDFGGRGFSSGVPFPLVSEPYTLSNADKVLVDGVETTAGSLTLEGGKTYVITYIEYAQDGDYWLFA